MTSLYREIIGLDFSPHTVIFSRCPYKSKLEEWKFIVEELITSTVNNLTDCHD